MKAREFRSHAIYLTLSWVAGLVLIFIGSIGRTFPPSTGTVFRAVDDVKDRLESSALVLTEGESREEPSGLYRLKIKRLSAERSLERYVVEIRPDIPAFEGRSPNAWMVGFVVDGSKGPRQASMVAMRKLRE